MKSLRKKSHIEYLLKCPIEVRLVNTDAVVSKIKRNRYLKKTCTSFTKKKEFGCIKVRTHDLTISEFAFLTAFPLGHGGFHTLALKTRGFKPTV